MGSGGPWGILAKVDKAAGLTWRLVALVGAAIRALATRRIATSATQAKSSQFDQRAGIPYEIGGYVNDLPCKSQILGGSKGQRYRSPSTADPRPESLMFLCGKVNPIPNMLDDTGHEEFLCVFSGPPDGTASTGVRRNAHSELVL